MVEEAGCLVSMVFDFLPFLDILSRILKKVPRVEFLDEKKIEKVGVQLSCNFLPR
jgi:hypothetical protein